MGSPRTRSSASRRTAARVPRPPAAPGLVAENGAGSAVSTEALTSAILETALDCIIVIDERGRVVEWNPAASRTFGYRRTEALGRELAELIIPERLRDAHREGLSRHLATGEGSVLGRRVEMIAVRADGAEVPVELAVSRVDGERTLFAGYLRDITERRERERALQAATLSLEAADRRHRTLLERLPSIAYRAGLGDAGRWHYISPQVEDILGYTPSEWMADPAFWDKKVHPEDLEWVLAEERRCAEDGRAFDAEYRIIARDGRTVWVRDRSSVGSPEAEGTIVEGLLTDVTDRRLAEERLRHLVDHDDLTGLLNRRGFEYELDRRLESAALEHWGAVAVIDVDHLKRINDSLGHAAGDRVIKEVASVLRLHLREEDLFARLSGDEFGLLMAGIGERDARRRVGQLLEAVRARPGFTAVTASGGIAMITDPENLTASDLLIAADTALYEAKNRGRDRVAMFGGENQRRLEWVSQVRAAIEEQRLVLYAQPLIELSSGKVWGEELLVRMLDDRGEPVEARQFIPVAESFGLIRQVDRWVLARALELAGAGKRVSVNLSAASITDNELARLIETGIRQRGIDPSLIVFEITETVATPAIESLREFAARIERLGCRLALDDVGTGFGSLTYLRHLPFSYLKIDSDFVRGLAESEADALIVRALASLAREFGMRTVAEGVDSPAVLERLKGLGIDYAQGFLLGRPAQVTPPG